MIRFHDDGLFRRTAAPFVRVCALADLADPGTLRVELSGTPVAVVRTEGDVYAIHDVCSHAEVSLADGDVDGSTIECWLHGSRFDLRSGRPTGLPATRPVPVYRTRVEGDDVFVAVDDH